MVYFEITANLCCRLAKAPFTLENTAAAQVCHTALPAAPAGSGGLTFPTYAVRTQGSEARFMKAITALSNSSSGLVVSIMTSYSCL